MRAARVRVIRILAGWPYGSGLVVVSDRATPLPVTLASIAAAAARIDGSVIRTPMLHSQTLSEITGARVFVKFENLQFTASFKERGALNKLLLLSVDQRSVGVVAMSAGNHAQGVAYHAARLGIPATIVMPVATPITKVEHTRKHGARVILHGESLTEASDFAIDLKRREGLVFLHPFDDADVISGQGTIALEMLRDAPEIDTLVVPVGGGGLISGMAVAAKALKPNIGVIGVQTSMYPSLVAERAGRDPAATSGGATIAEGIAVSRVGRLPFQITRQVVDDVVLVEESHLEQAITLYCTVEKTVAEGAGAAGLAALIAYPERFHGTTVGLVLCGGNIDSRLLASVLTRALVREQRIVRLRVVGDDRPGLLAGVATTIGSMGGNILEVAHNRLALDVPAKGAEFDVLMETRDAHHTQEILRALSSGRYSVRIV